MEDRRQRCRASTIPPRPRRRRRRSISSTSRAPRSRRSRSAQSGPPRDTPDYYALRVMNEMLGVLFQSRLNHNIREVKGYSYGVCSSFAFGRGPGAFRAGGDIVTAKIGQRADRVHEGAARHPRPASADRRRAASSEGEPRAEPAGRSSLRSTASTAASRRSTRRVCRRTTTSSSRARSTR